MVHQAMNDNHSMMEMTIDAKMRSVVGETEGVLRTETDKIQKKLVKRLQTVEEKFDNLRSRSDVLENRESDRMFRKSICGEIGTLRTSYTKLNDDVQRCCKSCEIALRLIQTVSHDLKLVKNSSESTGFETNETKAKVKRRHMHTDSQGDNNLSFEKAQKLLETEKTHRLKMERELQDAHRALR